MTKKERIKAVFVIGIVVCVFVLFQTVDCKEKTAKEARDAEIDAIIAEGRDANDHLDIVCEHIDRINANLWAGNRLLKLVYTDSNGIEALEVGQAERW